MPIGVSCFCCSRTCAYVVAVCDLILLMLHTLLVTVLVVIPPVRCAFSILRLQFRGRDISSTCDISRAERKCTGDVVATIRPIRRLLPKFESLCSWPVTVSVSDASLWSYKRDLAQCLAVTVFTAISTIMFGMFVPNFFSVYFIPSLSMYPTLNVGDAVLVRKMPLSSRPTIHRGDVVFFRPTPRLLELVRESETRDSSSVASPGAQRAVLRVRRRNLFVKRVAAVPGDLISIANHHIVVNGDYISEACIRKHRSRCAAKTGRLSVCTWR